VECSSISGGLDELVRQSLRFPRFESQEPIGIDVISHTENIPTFDEGRLETEMSRRVYRRHPKERLFIIECIHHARKPNSIELERAIALELDSVCHLVKPFDGLA
jgi:porphobilinogen deaminase